VTMESDIVIEYSINVNQKIIQQPVYHVLSSTDTIAKLMSQIQNTHEEGIDSANLEKIIALKDDQELYKDGI